MPVVNGSRGAERRKQDRDQGRRQDRHRDREQNHPDPDGPVVDSEPEEVEATTEHLLATIRPAPR